jgi:enterochelin esterase family protein
MQQMAAVFGDDLTQALIPFIDSHFRTLTDRDHRAMAGLSMGGMQTFAITFNHLDLFSYIGGFSGASVPAAPGQDKVDIKTAYNGAMADPAAFAKRVHVLFVGIGTDEHCWKARSRMCITSLQGQRTSGRPGVAT